MKHKEFVLQLMLLGCEVESRRTKGGCKEINVRNSHGRIISQMSCHSAGVQIWTYGMCISSEINLKKARAAVLGNLKTALGPTNGSD